MATAVKRRVKIARCKRCGATFEPMSDIYVVCPFCGSTEVEVFEQEQEQEF